MKRNSLKRVLCVWLCVSLVSLVTPGSIQTLASEARVRLKGAPIVSPSDETPIDRLLHPQNRASVDETIGTLYRPFNGVPNAPQSPLNLDISFNIGPIAVQLDITNPVAQPGGLFRSTLHIHARDDTQTPPFNGYLVATGQAADADTLLGGFLPAALIVLKDLAAGMTFQQAAADAQVKTGVTVTFLNDPGLTEYALILALIAIIAIAALTIIQPGLSNEACRIKTALSAGLLYLEPQAPPDPCGRASTTMLVASLPGALTAQSPLVLNISFSIGSIAVQLDMTRPVAQPAGLFSSTLHLHARDDTQTPAFNADLVATGQAADPDTLLGGFLPAALIVKQDLLANMTFQQAAADAQTKTAVTVTFLNDATLAEYGLLLALIAVVCLAEVTRVQPGLGDDACTIRTNLEAGLAAAGLPSNPPDSCTTPTPVPIP